MKKSILGLILSAGALVSTISAQCIVDPKLRDDCGYLGITQGECESRGCCWSPTDPVYPWCFFSSNEECSIYQVQSSTPIRNGMSLSASLNGRGCNYYGDDIKNIKIDIVMETNERLHVKIYDADSKRWEVPNEILPRPSLGLEPSAPLYKFSYNQRPFGFQVYRSDTGQVVFNSSASTQNPLFRNLIFEDQYLEISTQLPEGANIYGLGERVHPLKLTPKRTYTIWTADETMPDNQNIYGAHPFYMELRAGKAHGVLLLNSNGMDVDLEDGFLTYKVIGGVLDFYFFMGPTPADVVAQYTEFVGRPFMIPYWSLGFHQCRWGYRTLDEVKEVVRRYRESNIPLETMWTDIDYMEDYKVWTFDPIRFNVNEVREFVNELHNQNQRYILITDPGIKNLPGYRYYELGLDMDIYIRSGKTGNPFVGRVWPGNTVFPDFLNPKSYDYWYQSIKEFLDLVPVDGIWIDMNEVANFCQGECFNFESETNSTVMEQIYANRPKSFDPNNPPYQINNRDQKYALNYKTTDMDAYHIDGILEYDAHNLYGIAESIVTRKAVEVATNKRAFVLSRSTFPGSGHHTGHWTGDNFATWEHLYWSIPGIINTNIYGIPFIGADICGFIFDTTEELCARWMQLGAFYPFSRNHNNLDSKPQEPYLWDSVAAVSREALNIRYSLLNYYYTLFYHAHSRGTTVARPLFFEFPTDPEVVAIDKQFFIGHALLITPVLEQGGVTVKGYFPKGTWYDFRTFEQITLSKGDYIELKAPLEVIPLHIRGGYVLPLQTPKYSTKETRSTEFSLIVALDESGSAKGDLYLDDGESLNTQIYSLIEYVASTFEKVGRLTGQGLFNFKEPQVLDKVTVLGVNFKVNKVQVNGQSITFLQDITRGIVEFTGLGLSMNQEFSIEWEE